MKDFRQFSRLLALAACAFVAGGAGNAGAATDVLPYKAVYRLELGESRSGETVALEGEFRFEWRDACDRWDVSRHLVLRFTDQDEQVHWMNRWHLTWEAKDGRAFRFSTRTEGSWGTIKGAAGKAMLHEDGSGGAVEYEHPWRRRVMLPAGTLFPAFHFLATLDDFDRPAGRSSDVVFSGSGNAGLYRVETVFGDPKPANPSDPDDDPAAPPGREIRSFYYPYFDHGELPDSEVRSWVRADGVVDSFVINNIDTSIVGKLESLEELAPPEC